MSRIRKLLVVLLAIVSPLAMAAGPLAPAMTTGDGDHRHYESLAIEDGELHVVLHHHDDGAGAESGKSIESADHDVPLVNHSAAAAVVKRQTDRASIAVRLEVVTIAVPMSATAAPARANETPPPLLPFSDSILRI